MKYLLVVLVVLFAIWLWRHNRREPPHQTHHRPPPPAASPTPPPTQDMVACAHCGLHLPIADAVPGAQAGVYYCGQAHRLQGDGQS